MIYYEPLPSFATFCHPTGAWADLPTDTKNLWSEQPKETTPAKQQFSSCGANSMSLVGTSRGQHSCTHWDKSCRKPVENVRNPKMKTVYKEILNIQIVSTISDLQLQSRCTCAWKCKCMRVCAHRVTKRGGVLIVLYDWLILIASCKYYV